MGAERCGTHVAAQHKACTPSPPPPPPPGGPIAQPQGQHGGLCVPVPIPIPGCCGHGEHLGAFP